MPTGTSLSGTERCWSIATARIGKLQDVYVDVENDEPQFATVNEGFISRHLTLCRWAGSQIAALICIPALRRHDLQTGTAAPSARWERFPQPTLGGHPQ